MLAQKHLSQLSISAPGTFRLDYGSDIEAELAILQAQIGRYSALVAQFPSRWLAIKLLEEDDDIQQKLLLIAGGPPVLTHTQLSLARLKETIGEDIDTLLADRRYCWIHSLVQETTQAHNHEQLTLSDRVDKIVTHRWLGIPIFLLAMWAVFKLTADVSAPYLDWIDSLFSGPITNWTLGVMAMLGLGGSWLESLLVDGVISGVGGVLVFVPVLMSLYLALAVLEDSGYMARAAFVMDRSMSKIGLHGKSFLPLMVGFGCSVPAIYATRTLSDDKDRILTALLVPFMSCGARLPVYVLFATIFFPQQASLVIFGLYLLGIVTAVALGLLLRRTLFQQGEQTAFVMELPPYRLPTVKSTWLHMWQRTSAFIKSAWSLILIASVVIWLLMAIPTTSEGHFAATDLEDSLFATAAQTITPIMAPLGFGEWQATSALITGFVAKEVVVSTLAQTYSAADLPADAPEPSPTFFDDLREIFTTFVQATIDTVKAIPLLIGIDLRDVDDGAADSTLSQGIRDNFEVSSGGYGALAGLAFMIFVLIYTPCMVTLSAQRQELGAKWMWLSIVGQLALAWLMAFIVFQVGVHLL